MTHKKRNFTVDFQGVDFGQVVQLLQHKSNIINKLQKQLEREKKMSGSDLRLVLLGRSGSEKRAAGNLIMGGEEMIQEGASPEIQQSVSRQGEVNGRKVTVVETPHWFCSGGDLEELRVDVELCVRLSAPGPHAFLLIIPVKESAGGIEMLERMEIFGESCWSYTMILFIVTDQEQEKTIEEFVQSGAQEVQRLLEKCGNRFHCLNINQRDESQLSNLMEKIEKMTTKTTERFYSSETFQPESQIQKMEEKLRREREERDAFGRQVEEKDREIQTLIQQLTDLKTIQDPKPQCVIS